MSQPHMVISDKHSNETFKCGHGFKCKGLGSLKLMPSIKVMKTFVPSLYSPNDSIDIIIISF
jgi:hypothetical protein